MSRGTTIKSILGVTISNATAIVSGALVGFALPRILSMSDYGSYKTYTLYSTYLGLFCLGISDGITLRYGDYDYNQLDRPKFRTYFKIYLLIHLFFAVLMFGISLCFLRGETRFIVCALAIQMVITNGTGYFQQIAQITRRFKEFSVRKTLQSIISIGSALLLILLYIRNGTVSYRAYVIFVTSLNALLLVWYFHTYHDIIFGQSQGIRENIGDISDIIKNGFPLLFANLCASLLLTLDRQFVNVLFDNETYAVYAFAYNMLSLVTVATSAISTVLYPTLKRASLSSLKHIYNTLIGMLLVFLFFSMLVYFPLNVFVKHFLPKYADALVIFRIIFPGLAISSCITVIMHNYYKIFGANILYFKKSLIVIGISAAANAVAYMIFKDTISISVASIISMLFWFVFVEKYLSKLCEIDRLNNLGYICLMSAGFYFFTAIDSILLSGALYLMWFLLITMFLQKRNLAEGLMLLKE